LLRYQALSFQYGTLTRPAQYWQIAGTDDDDDDDDDDGDDDDDDDMIKQRFTIKYV
jgi:hypothetical protein